MRKKKQLFILLIVLITLFGCSKGMGKNYNNKIKLFNSFPIEVSLDLLYLVHSNAIYFADMESNKIHKYDFNGNLLFEFGNKGKGPGEFITIFNLFYDISNGHIGIDDPALQRITYIDTLGNLISTKKHEEGKYFKFCGGIKNSSTANIKLAFFADKSKLGKTFVEYELELDKINSAPQIITKETLQRYSNSSKNASLYIDLNEKYVFYGKFPHRLPIKPPNYHITMFDYSGNKKEWKPKFVPYKVKKMSYFFMSNKYIFILASEYILIYDFPGNYLGYLKFKESGGLIAVKNKKIFVLNDSGDDLILEIYDMNF